jgi:hypothetical protein
MSDGMEVESDSRHATNHHVILSQRGTLTRQRMNVPRVFV